MATCGLVVTSLVVLMAARSLALTISDRSDCTDILANSVGYEQPSGRYHLLVGDGKRPVWVYCDMTTDGGGWTVIQRRTNNTQTFYQDWATYETGFGNVNSDHWLGLTYLHSITYNKRYVLRIEFTDWNDNKYYAEYDDFRIGGAGCNYTLQTIGQFCGSCGDSLEYQVGNQFSTKDRDHDKDAINCAERYKGGWWYASCLHSNLNGDFKSTGGPDKTYDDGIIWHSCRGYYYSFKSSVMMIRPFYF